LNTKGTKCPKCNKDIGVWVVMKAIWPTMLKCPHCKVKLQYKPTGWAILFTLTVAYAVVFLTGLRYSLIYTYYTYPYSLFVVPVIGIILWLPFEYYLAIRLRKKHELIAKNAS
jgi:hypothetical protein